MFSLSCYVLFSVSFCFVMFSPSLFKLLHLQSKQHIYKHKNKHKNSKEHITKHKTKQKKQQKSPSQTLRYIYFSRRFVGWKSRISVVYVLSLSLYALLSVSFCCCFMFSPSLFKLLHLQSKQHI